MGTATVFAWLRLSAQWLDADQQGPRYGAGAGASRAAPTRAHAAVAALVAVSLGCRTVQGVTVAQAPGGRLSVGRGRRACSLHGPASMPGRAGERRPAWIRRWASAITHQLPVATSGSGSGAPRGSLGLIGPRAHSALSEGCRASGPWASCPRRPTLSFKPTPSVAWLPTWIPGTSAHANAESDGRAPSGAARVRVLMAASPTARRARLEGVSRIARAQSYARVDVASRAGRMG